MKTRQKEMEFHQKEMLEHEKDFAGKYNRYPIFLGGNSDSTVYYINGKISTKNDYKELDPDKIEEIEVKKEKKNDKSIGIINITTKK